jgi:outer membrane immunogenic protein
MRTIWKGLLAVAMAAGATSAAQAQSAQTLPAPQEDYRGDAALTYHWVHTNAGPGECGCFGLNGAGISGSWNVRNGWSAVAEMSSELRRGSSMESSLTVTSFLGGARYRLPQPWLKGEHRPQPFAQVLIGPAHSGGGEAGVGDHTWAFAARLGGGIDIPMKSRFEIRAIQVDWFRTQFANAKNDRQNNLLVAAGITYRWSIAK